MREVNIDDVKWGVWGWAGLRHVSVGGWMCFYNISKYPLSQLQVLLSLHHPSET